MKLFWKSAKSAVSVPHGHLAYVRDNGQVVDLGKVTDEDMRLLYAVVEHSYRNRTKSGRGPTAAARSRVRGMLGQWKKALDTK